MAATRLIALHMNKGRTVQNDKLFKVANWGGILYFAFIHIGICILLVVFNAGMEATGDIEAAVSMTISVLKSELIPLLAGFVVCDLFVTIGWVGMVLKRMLPVKKWMLICCPVFGVIFGNREKIWQ